MPLPVRNNRIRLSQGHVFWREIGEGEVLVFLHGAWSTGEQWLSVIQSLGQSYQCIAPDLLGFGESSRQLKRYSIQLEVDCLAEYLKFLRIKRCVLVGYGIGAWVAVTYALTHPEGVSGLVVAAPEGVMTSELRGRYRGWGVLSSPIPLVGWCLRLWSGVVGVFGGRSLQSTLRLRRMLRQSPAACQLLFRRRNAELQGESVHDRLSELPMPMLVLQSDMDTTEQQLAAHLYAQAPRATVEVVPTIGVPDPWKLTKEESMSQSLYINEAIAPVIKSFVSQKC
jgi:pimeloyl-ACP methyl ester carboxylesterase